MKKELEKAEEGQKIYAKLKIQKYRLIDASSERSWHSFLKNKTKKQNRFPGKSEVRLKKRSFV